MPLMVLFARKQLMTRHSILHTFEEHQSLIFITLSYCLLMCAMPFTQNRGIVLHVRKTFLVTKGGTRAGALRAVNLVSMIEKEPCISNIVHLCDLAARWAVRHGLLNPPSDEFGSPPVL
jgi:hypothetical protein